MEKRVSENLQGIALDYIAPFFWLHGEERECLIRELDAVARSGIRSVCFESRVHEDFAQDKWWSDMRFLLEECKKRGMRAWILDERHCPSGSANRAFETEYRHLRPFEITERHMDAAGPVENACVLADAWKEGAEDQILAVIAYRHIPDCEILSNESIDLTEGLSGDAVYFSLPEGMWRIIFLIQTREGVQPFGDKLNPLATEVYIHKVYEPHYQHLKEYFGNTLRGFFSDEPGFYNNQPGVDRYQERSFATEMGRFFANYPWGKIVYQRLKKIYGSEIYSKLVGLWMEIADGVSSEVRYHYMNSITAEYQKNYTNPLADWCSKHGVEYIGHVLEDNNVHAQTGYGAGHFFRAIGRQDMSGIDVVLCSILPGLTECSSSADTSYHHVNHDFYCYYLAKLGASFGHLDAKKRGRTMCEIFGAYGWAEGTKIMLYLSNHMLVRGINYFVPHAFSPLENDSDSPPHFYENGKNPQFKYFGKLMDYLNRSCHMLTDGIHVPTCAIVYDAEARWMNGTFLPLEKVAKKLYDNLFDYDIIPFDFLGQLDEDGKINGETYPLLLWPYAEHLPKELEEKLHLCGVPVVCVTEHGEKTPFETVLLENLCDDIERRGLRDVQADYRGIFLRYYHYRREESDIYLFVNEDIHHEIRTKVSLSCFEGGSYVLYDAMENTVQVKESANAEIELCLPTYGAVMVLPNETAEGGKAEEFAAVLCERQEPKLIYEISLCKEQGEYQHYRTTDRLFSVTGRDEIPNFSGNIRYQAKLMLQTGKSCVLDLGAVGETAEVFLNGQAVGIRLAPPYRFEITKWIKEGENDLTVFVTNSLGFEKRDPISRFLVMEPSGLLGPVQINYYQTNQEENKQ